MSSSQSIVDFILEQTASAGDVSVRKMFGDYGLYCDGKVVALVCDDQLFVKPTAAGHAFIGDVTEAPAYPGAKPSLLIENDRWEDREWISHLIRITAAELPIPKPKKTTAKATR